MTKEEFQKRLDELNEKIVGLVYELMETEEVPFSMLDLTIMAPKDEDPQVVYGMRVAPKDALAVAITKDGRMFALMANDEEREMDSSEEARRKAVNDMLNDILKKKEEGKGDTNGTN